MRPLRILMGVASALALTLSASVFAADSYVFTTMAGTSNLGYADGARSAARFALPAAVAVGADGTVYVGDSDNFVVRKIAPDGTVSTLAGKAGVYGYVDGTGSSASFFAMFGIAVDGTGTVFVSDAYANTIRKISPGGVVTTLAGKEATAGNADGVGPAARFSSPTGLACDSDGNVYVADLGNAAIRKITPTGAVTTIAAAAGAAITAKFREPYGVAVDASGNIYVTDVLDATIWQITPAGAVTTIAGTSGAYGANDGYKSAARFESPSGIAVDRNGNLYVADQDAYNVRLIDPTGAVTTYAGEPYLPGYQDTSLRSSRFNHPSDVAIDAVGNLYVADTYNGVIRKLGASGQVSTYAGQPAGGTDGVRAAARFFGPDGIAFDASGIAYIADTYNHTVRKMTPDGKVTTIAGLAGVAGRVDGAAADARFTFPQGVAVDGSGNVFVSDFGNNTIRKITPAGIVGTIAGAAQISGSDDGTGIAARFSGPTDMKFDQAGNLIIADSQNDTLRRMTPDGTVTTIAGVLQAKGWADGPAAQAKFKSPYGLAFDSSGNLYIADTGNSVIRKLTTDGMVTTVAGVAGQTGPDDGKGAAARFDHPTGITVDPQGNIFIADEANLLIRKMTPDGTVTTIGGSGFIQSTDGINDAASLFYPTAIASDLAGNLYITDQGNDAIRVAGLVGAPKPTSRLANLSVRANLVANQRLIAGFYVTGAAKTILVRAIGPGMAPYVGGAQVASDPRLEMYDQALNLVQANEDWGGTAALRDAFSSVGAFPIPDDSHDAATTRDIAGLQTVHVLTPGSGIALVEAYDTGSGVASRLTNLSARYTVGSTGALIAGFAIIGTNQKTLLIRGVGPTLASFGVNDAIADPRISLYNADRQIIASNDDWSPSLESTFDAVYAPRFVADSKDAALLVTLAPGTYTAQLSGPDGVTGQALVEIYEVGN